MPLLASSSNCTGCLACIDACNHKALSVKWDKGHRYIKINNNLLKLFIVIEV